ncbi:hypothetical protein ACQY0O_007548 [Thecaphora frezii]
MVKIEGKWSGLLAAVMLSTGVAAQTIDYLMSTEHHFQNYMEVTKPNIEFKEGKPLNKSIEASGNQPLKIGFNIDDSERHQTIEHLGGSVTDATGITLADIRKHNPELYCEILNMLYSQKEEWIAVGGVAMTSVRHPLGCSDFSLNYYSYDDPQKCGAEFKGDLEYFNLQGSSPKLWQVLLDIKAIVEDGSSPSNPRNLSTRVLPWTLNPSAKTNGAWAGDGHLKQESEGYYVDYMHRSIKELCKLGSCPEWFSLQESPQHQDKTVPTMLIDAEQAARLANNLYDKISKDEELLAQYFNAPPLKLCALEASWMESDYNYARTVLNKAGKAFAATCWQGYVGYNATYQTLIERSYDTKTLFTEMTYTLSADPWGNLRDFVFKVGVNAIQHGTSDINVWQTVLQTDKDMSSTFPSLEGACKACIANILVFPEASGHYRSQMQHGYGTKDEPQVDWLHINNELSSTGKLTIQNAQQLNSIQIEQHGAKKPISDVFAKLDSTSATGGNNGGNPGNEQQNPTRFQKRRKSELLKNGQANSTDSSNSSTNSKIVPPEQCFKDRGMTFKYKPTQCAKMSPPQQRKAGKAAYGPGGAYARTSQMDFIGQLGAAVSPRGKWANGIRISSSTTEQETPEDVVNGRVIGTAFEQIAVGDDKKDGAESRFCALLLNWNDHDQKNFNDPVTTVISFRGKVAEFTSKPGVYTLCWNDESSYSYYAKHPKLPSTTTSASTSDPVAQKGSADPAKSLDSDHKKEATSNNASKGKDGADAGAEGRKADTTSTGTGAKPVAGAGTGTGTGTHASKTGDKGTAEPKVEENADSE